MNVLLTGATGLLGLHVAGELVRQGHAVKAVYRSLPQPFSALPWFKDIDWVKGAITSATEMEAAVRGADAVIHAAARTEPSPSDLSAYVTANITATQNILSAVQKWHVGRLVYVSTAAVYGPGTLTQPATEESPYAFHLMRSGYIASKYQAQQRVLQAVRQGTNAVIVNPAFMLGPYDFKPSSGAILQHVLRRGPVFYPGAGGKSFIDVRDAARATVNALTMGQTGHSYLLANESLTYDQFFALAARLSGKKKHLIPVLAPVLRAAGRLGSSGEQLLRRPFQLNHINAVLMTQDNYYSGEKARRELAMPATPVAQAIADALEWFKEPRS